MSINNTEMNTNPEATLIIRCKQLINLIFLENFKGVSVPFPGLGYIENISDEERKALIKEISSRFKSDRNWLLR